jgi:hypothetical protein
MTDETITKKYRQLVLNELERLNEGIVELNNRLDRNYHEYTSLADQVDDLTKKLKRRQRFPSPTNVTGRIRWGHIYQASI